MKENLNIGTMIPGAQSMANNAVLEKYCHSDSQDSCTKYGGLYQWDEVMQYLVTGYQGICPQGWHLPIDEDWKVLEGAVDTHTAIGSPDWDNLNLRGVNSGENLKSSSFWLEGGNGSDAYGFDARPGGYLVQGGAFGSTGYDGLWWSSPVSSTSRAWTRYLSAVSDQSGRSSYDKSNSFLVCIIKICKSALQRKHSKLPDQLSRADNTCLLCCMVINNNQVFSIDEPITVYVFQ
ncbi:MAG: hypothetical protein IPH45_04960 [Bacteroidales bacterium]|nr:hypothetical protein [Bacteroidales bacterium]